MSKVLKISIIVILSIVLIILIIFLCKKIHNEKYVKLKNISNLLPKFNRKYTRTKNLPKKNKKHKYSRGTDYDRGKVRKNRFQKNYIQ